MQMSSHTAVLFLLSLIYFIFSAGGLAFLYVYYGQQIDILEKQLIKQTSELTAEGNVPAAYDISKETGGRTKDEDLDDESSFGISSYHDYQDGAILPLHCCIGNETHLKQLVGQWTRKSIERYLGTRDSTTDDSDRFGSVSDYGSYNNGNAQPSALVLGQRRVSLQGGQSNTRQEMLSWKVPGKVMNNRKSYLNNVALDQGRLTVSVEGFYLVYSKVNFDINETPGNDFSESLFHYTVVDNKELRPESQNLMRSGVPTCSQDSSTYQSSFHSGIFQLFSGDEISVMVSVPENSEVTYVPQNSFFGLYLITEN